LPRTKDLGHDLQNSIAVVRNSLEALVRLEKETSGPRRRLLLRAIRQSVQVSRIANRLLAD
jgi:hypothetical protein